MRRLASMLFAVSMVAACGSDDEDVGSTQTGGAGGSGAVAGSGGTEADSGGASGAGFGGILVNDAGPPRFDGPELADAGWFDCTGCACNGATHYCMEVAGGAKAPGAPPPPDAALCNDTGAFGCTPLPQDCVAAPSCNCIPARFGGACQCSDVGGGLHVFCALP